MSSFRTKENITLTIDKAGNHFIGARCVNPLKNSDYTIKESLDMWIKVGLTPLPHVTGHVPHKIVNGEFVRL